MFSTAPSSTALTRAVNTTGKLATYPLFATKWGLPLVMVALGAICGARALIGLRGCELFSHDAFVVLDGAWRMLNGQRPHIDFSSHLGVFSYLPTLVGLLLCDNRVQGLAYGQAICAFVLGMLALILSRSRMQDMVAAIVCLLVALTVADPSAIGFPLKISPATTYNRYGYAMLGIVFIEAFMQPGVSVRRRDFWGGLTTGSITCILFFMKVTYGMAAVFLLICLVRCRPQTHSRWAGCAVGFCMVLIPVLFYFGFDIRPMLGDLTLAAHAKRINALLYDYNQIVEGLAATLALGLAACVLLLNDRDAESAFAVAAGSFAVSCAGVVLVLTNYEQGVLPLSALFAALLIASIIARIATELRPCHVAVIALALVSIVVPFLWSSSAIGYGLIRAFHTSRQFAAMDAPRVRGFIPVNEETSYTELVNDGLSLIRAKRNPRETIMCLDFSNPFSYALGVRPAPGGSEGLDYQTTFDDVHRLSAERLFGQADLVMWPKTFTGSGLQDAIPRLYGGFLQTHFRKVGDSRHWELYRRD